jgi:catechol 2,3-dioxygenase-like lactoylglutathione lyase family enzyme
VGLELLSLIVEDYDEALEFFTHVLGFELVEDSPSFTNDGRAKRWVVVRPPNAQTGILLARADGPEQRAGVGKQFFGRVGLFYRVEDFDHVYERMVRLGVEFLGKPRDEAYGRVVVFKDLCGNKWDLLGPRLVVL